MIPTIRLAGLLLLAILAGCGPLERARTLVTPAPLSPIEPLSASTHNRLEATVAGYEACTAWLDQAGVTFTRLADTNDGEACRVEGAVGLGDDLGARTVRLSPRRPMMACPLAAATYLWISQGVQPAAREIYGADVVGIDHLGVYACRRVNNAAQGRISAHATASALDVAGFRLSNGRRVTVSGQWSDTGDDGRFLRRVRDDACRVFSTTLSPDYNALHADHLHLEMAPGRLCR